MPANSRNIIYCIFLVEALLQPTTRPSKRQNVTLDVSTLYLFTFLDKSPSPHSVQRRVDEVFDTPPYTPIPFSTGVPHTPDISKIRLFLIPHTSDSNTFESSIRG